MAEKLKNNSEKIIGSVEANQSRADQLKTLTEMGGKFDADKAKQLKEVDKPREAEMSSKSTRLGNVEKKDKRKSVEDLTPEEAAKEYLDILMDLSNDFTSAEGKSSRVASYDRNGDIQVHNRGYSGAERRIVGQVYETATGKNFCKERDDLKNNFENGKWNDKYIDRELALGMADDIISAESDWRAASESTTVEAEQSEKAILEKEKAKAKNKLKKMDHGIFGKLKKGFYMTFRKKEYNRLYSLAQSRCLTEAGRKAANADTKLQRALEAAYSEDYGYGHHRLDYSRDKNFREQKNSEYNDRFFDKAKKEEIDRAVELRRRLESEGVMKNKVH